MKSYLISIGHEDMAGAAKKIGGERMSICRAARMTKTIKKYQKNAVFRAFLGMKPGAWHALNCMKSLHRLHQNGGVLLWIPRLHPVDRISPVTPALEAHECDQI